MANESITCFDIARKAQIPQYLVNEEFSTSTLNINDICDAIKADIILKKYKKDVKNEFAFHNKMNREIEKNMEKNNYKYNGNEDEDVVYLLNILHYNHVFVCKLVGENMNEIKSILNSDSDKENGRLYEKYYDYCYIINLIWGVRYEYAQKNLKTQITNTLLNAF
jgi:hypothetical protein